MDRDIDLSGIIGPKATAEKFAEEWTSLKNVTYEVRMDEMVYKLESINEVPISKGHLRQASEADLDLVSNWMMQFNEEAVQPISFKEAQEASAKKIKEGAIYIWEDKQPVSIASWTRPTSNGITVSYVYTPKNFRNKGYATSCVAALSRLLLNKYQFCCLFTDLSNPTSNGIYQRIGYKAVNHVLQIQFAGINTV